MLTPIEPMCGKKQEGGVKERAYVSDGGGGEVFKCGGDFLEVGLLLSKHFERLNGEPIPLQQDQEK